jgi:multiple sugar transport system substrate-binding protein
METAPVEFAFWSWSTDIVLSNIREFERQNRLRVISHEIPGEYGASLELKLKARTSIDVFYAQRGEASRWYAAGLLTPIDHMPGLDVIRDRMQRSIDEDSKAPDGRYLGLTYYNGGPFCLFRNEALLSAAGFDATGIPSDYPQTWEEVHGQSKELKRKGISEHPILISWHNAPTGLPWALIAQCFSEGEQFVGSDLQASFGIDTPLLKVLADWKQWWTEELVPRGTLEMDEVGICDSWQSGRHAFHPHIDYKSYLYNGSDSPLRHQNHQNPVMPGAARDTVLVGHALLCTSARSRTAEHEAHVWKLMTFLGYADENGDLSTHKRWVANRNLAVPFPEIYEDPICKVAILNWMYPPLAEVEFSWLVRGRGRALAPRLLRAPWYKRWEPVARHMIGTELLRKGSATPREVATQLRRLWDRLWEEGGT